jgi:Spy/CpxP family protein refolding chaperone
VIVLYLIGDIYAFKFTEQRRIKMKRIMVVLAFWLSIGTLLAQQGPPPMGPRGGMAQVDALKSFLQLTDAQVTDLKGLLTSFRDATKPIHEQIMTKQKSLKDELAKATPDSAVVAQLMVDMKSLRNQIKTKHDELRPQLLALLTDPQKTSLATLQQALTQQQAAHQAVALGLLEAPANAGGDGPGFGGGWGRRHPGPMEQP